MTSTLTKNIFASILPLFFLCVPFTSFATGYKVTPLVIDREVKQRDIFTEFITITNNNNFRTNIYPSVNEVNLDEGGDIAQFSPASVSDNTITPTSWISISRARQSVESGQTVTIPMEVRIHPEAKPGVYHVFLGFGTGTNRPQAEQQARSGDAPGVVVTLSIEQEKNEFLKLKKFIVDRFVTTPENTAISYTLDNPGSSEVTPKGEIIFSNNRGEEVAAIPINPNNEQLAPGQQTTYVIAAPTADMLGKYKAFLSVDYGTTQVASVYDTAFFYVIPWQRLAIIFGIVLLLALIVTFWLHRRYAGMDDYEPEDHHVVPLFYSNTVSDDKDHDINLKQK